MSRPIGRPRSYDERRVSMTLRLPESLHKRVRAEADRRDVGTNWLLTRCVERWLEGEEGRDPGDPWVGA